VDTTGGGDMYVSGFLYGLLHGQDLAKSARLGNMAAIEVLKQLGARPKSDLSELLDRTEFKAPVTCTYEPHSDSKKSQTR
jgi:sugar/nucleoside kinase (ribokinase family)